MVHAPSFFNLFAIPPLAAAATSAALTLALALLVGFALRGDELIPDSRISLRNFIEVLFGGIADLAQDVIGPDWRKYMPYLGTLGLFILVSNLLNLVPGFGAPTGFIETSLAWSIISVTTSELASIGVHGFSGWLKHMAPGPIWLAPLIFPIEFFSHLIRFFSLTIRITANMFADHTLLSMFLGSFGALIALLVPWVVLGLGLFICFVQAFIFVFLSMLYIGMGIEESHESH
ncbi:MAG TPA: F0F1 ATP synthase subunit A [Myxococcota bacterium]|nr:F0F1 ATP synthase subunit A [Myxococcota bacterium]